MIHGGHRPNYSQGHLCEKGRSKNIDLHITRSDISEGIFSWDAWKFLLGTGKKNILLNEITVCPYCGIDLEKEYQAWISPPKQEQTTYAPELLWGC